MDAQYTKEETETFLQSTISEALGADVVQSCTVMQKGKKVFGFVVVNHRDDVRPVINLLRTKKLGNFEIRAQLHQKSNQNQQMEGRQMGFQWRGGYQRGGWQGRQNMVNP